MTIDLIYCIYFPHLNYTHINKCYTMTAENKHHTEMTQPHVAPRRRLNHKKTNENLDLCGITTLLRKKMMERNGEGDFRPRIAKKSPLTA